MQMSEKDRKWLQPALDLIARYAPATYARMRASDWCLFVSESSDDLTWIADTDGPEWYWPTVMQMPSALGLTLDQNTSGVSTRLKHTTILNRPDMEATAERLNVPIAHEVAGIIVHEFTHRDTNANEPQAYAAGEAFDRAMGDYAMAEDAEESNEYARQVQGNYYGN